ncbi:MAG: M23 family metallopeptidase [Rubrobacter sp.]|jgi:murein DD-endopeptidase MepM/ murein hydrolase activator NlpD|nr:M23 family metallopeptidase [Rubrobacter sp.]
MRNRYNILGFVLLTLAAVMGVVGSGAGAQAQSPGTPVAQKTGGEAVGAAVVHPAGWNVERETYTYDDTYGYTLWYPDTGEAHDHGGKPALRVALAYELKPQDIDAEVDAVLADYPGLPLKREAVNVAREHEGVAVGPIPGGTPYTAVYVPVNGRVYKINAYADDPEGRGLDARSKELLSDVRFERPSRSVGSLGLTGANSPEALYPSGPEASAVKRQEDGKAPVDLAAAASDDGPSITATRTTTKGGGETRIAEGCWRADPRFFVQTQHGYRANASGGDGIPTGWTQIGVPNFWGQYTHGNLGYGRCAEPYYANDKYAVDYPLNRWDHVFSPFSCGTVTYAGRNQTHADYGIFVSIKACNGKYVNLSAHLEALGTNNGDRLSKGDRVTRNTVIGYAGDTGGGNIAVGRVHVHTAFYRYPKENPDGSPYGGAGLQIVRNHYVGTAARRRGIEVDSRVYNYARVTPRKAFCREDRRCGEEYLVSN